MFGGRTLLHILEKMQIPKHWEVQSGEPVKSLKKRRASEREEDVVAVLWFASTSYASCYLLCYLVLFSLVGWLFCFVYSWLVSWFYAGERGGEAGVDDNTIHCVMGSGREI